MSQTNEVLFESINNAGIITLNRPKDLNALNVGIVSQILPKLKEWENTKTCVIIKGAGNKAFCAGGDIKQVSLNVHIEDSTFIFIEYNCDLYTNKYKIPYVALIDGITMGGGLGISVHGRYRVATERTLIAMPETRIGLVPDVGGTYFLPRLQGYLGTYLGLTGERLKGIDVLEAGIATHFVPRVRLLELETLLTKCRNESEVKAVLDSFHKPTGQSSLPDIMKDVNYCFAARTVEEILEKLKTVDNEWSRKTLKTLALMCPSSLKVTLAAIRRGAHMSLSECLKMEFRIIYHCRHTPNFKEGVRALLIDKDNKPQWRPSSLAEATDDYVEEFFKKLPDDQELKFFDSKL